MEHKDYVLPEVDLSRDDGDPRYLAGGPSTPLYRDDGTIRGYRWNGLPPGHYHDHWQSIADEWAQTVARFEADQDVYNSWWYLDAHPAYWAFDLKRQGDFPDNHVHHLDYDNSWWRQMIDIMPHRDDQGIFWSYETGKFDLLPVSHGAEQAHWHDCDLDGRADTYELAVIALAGKVHSIYGNDRSVVDADPEGQ